MTIIHGTKLFLLIANAYVFSKLYYVYDKIYNSVASLIFTCSISVTPYLLIPQYNRLSISLNINGEYIA